MISDSMVKLEENYGEHWAFFFKVEFVKLNQIYKFYLSGDSGADNLGENVEKEERRDKEKKKKHRSDRSRSRYEALNKKKSVI